ncbi:MAG: hypothetical protein ACP5PW_00115 [Candidatus Dormibacteria bacterium]
MGLGPARQDVFRRTGDAFRAGHVAVGARAADAAGVIVRASRRRMADRDGLSGEAFGSTLAHAEVNVLARLPFGVAPELVLTTTLAPCLQRSASIRLVSVPTVRFAGSDPLWAGCHDFGKLSPRVASCPRAELIGPRRDELGVFGAVIARSWPSGARTKG